MWGSEKLEQLLFIADNLGKNRRYERNRHEGWSCDSTETNRRRRCTRCLCQRALRTQTWPHLLQDSGLTGRFHRHSDENSQGEFTYLKPWARVKKKKKKQHTLKGYFKSLLDLFPQSSTLSARKVVKEKKKKQKTKNPEPKQKNQNSQRDWNLRYTDETTQQFYSSISMIRIWPKE